MSADVVAPPDHGTIPAPEAPSWFDRLLWLGPRVAEARANAFQAGQPGFDFYGVARELHDETSKLRRGDGKPWALLMLDCAAVEWLLRAHLARAGRSAATSPLGEDDWASVQHLPGVASAWTKFPPRYLPTLMAALGADRVATLAQLLENERKWFAAGLSELVQGLIEPLDIEAHRLGQALFARWFRVALVATTLVVALAWAASWVSARMSPNLALHRPVTASSTNGYAPDPNKITDGITNVMGVHTNGGDQQWLVIDLGEVKRFDKIVVYNRPDCCGERAVPLRVQVSNDNHDFKQIAERIEVFDKWTAKHLHAEGRYVRLMNTPPNLLHLAEVEIY